MLWVLVVGAGGGGGTVALLPDEVRRGSEGGPIETRIGVCASL